MPAVSGDHFGLMSIFIYLFFENDSADVPDSFQKLQGSKLKDSDRCLFLLFFFYKFSAEVSGYLLGVSWAAEQVTSFSFEKRFDLNVFLF